ncbi:sigma factor-like helix-turn-helix DNA-binding protein, partial [Amycolatopsis iheyensis]|uniref:sigma factor-like helix-turn-helix DNA-binding protein n=1 Tax=Amycolatopsis iheyensis TaxID=2945988 RepID=UPI0023EF0F43
RTRAVLAARFYLDLGEADTARLLGCGTGTVKSTTSRGLQRLRQLWEAESRSPENLPRPTSKGRR